MQRRLISSMIWRRKVTCTPAQMLWLASLEDDVRSCQLAFRGYLSAARTIVAKSAGVEASNAAALHHARGFVTAVRRVGRLLDTVNRSAFPPEVATVLKIQHKARKQFFSQFVGIRNGSEHVAEDVKHPEKYRTNEILLNPTTKLAHPILKGMVLSRSRLEIASLGSAPVTQSALDTVLSVRDAIITAVTSTCPKRKGELLLLFPLDVSGYDDSGAV